MSYLNRGKVIIMNNKYFDEFKVRNGIDQDVLVFNECFFNFGFEVICFDSFIVEEMRFNL